MGIWGSWLAFFQSPRVGGICEIDHSLGPDTLYPVDWHCGEEKGGAEERIYEPLVSVSVAVAAPQGGWLRTLDGPGVEP